MPPTELSMTANQKEEQENRQSPIENLALQNGLALVVLKGDDKSSDSRAIIKENNNSICENLYSSVKFAPKCAEFCGKAYENAIKAGGKISVKCHAGLYYEALPLEISPEKPLVAIVGRAFLKSEDYKIAAARAISGDWRQFPPTELFKNVHLASSESEIERVTKQLEKLVKKERTFLTQIAESEPVKEEKESSAGKNSPVSDSLQAMEISKMIEDFHRQNVTNENPVREKIAAEESSAWRSVFGSLLEMEYKNTSPAILNFLMSRYSLANLSWLENINDKLQPVLATGEFSEHSIEISISAKDLRLSNAVENEVPLELRERRSQNPNFEGKTINLFPVAVGGKVFGGLLVGDQLVDEKKHQIMRFIQNIAADLEILRLREKIKLQSRTTKAIQKLNETLKETDEENFWNSAAQISVELMRAERGSLLILDEESNELIVKAAVGNRADIIKQENAPQIGKRIARKVLQSGKPLVVKDLKKEGLAPAPFEWKYKTGSFISYPIIIGGRKIGVLNVTDTVDGETYGEADLELLDTLSPQLAVAIERSALRLKTIELRKISITDNLTGLVNRRYLEERLAEEINRSHRHGYQMSFMMIDVDEFKSYNDNFSHLEGDKALQIVGQCLKSTLRGADVAARYGGEEFSILLPQTNINEAYTIAERLREKVATTEFPNRQVTISVGIASCAAELCRAKELMSAADKALYQAKNKGRNNVQIFQAALSSDRKAN